jgi:hypothetical protein
MDNLITVEIYLKEGKWYISLHYAGMEPSDEHGPYESVREAINELKEDL